MNRDAMINRTEAEWDELQDALGTLWGWMKEGHVISAQDVADFTLIDKCQREDEEAATDAYNRGYQDGLRERGGDELVRLVRSTDDARIEAAVARTMEALANQRLDAALAKDEPSSTPPPAVSGGKEQGSSVAGLPAHVAGATATDAHNSTGKEDQ